MKPDLHRKSGVNATMLPAEGTPTGDPAKAPADAKASQARGFDPFVAFYSAPFLMPPGWLFPDATFVAVRIPGLPAMSALNLGAIYGIAPRFHIEGTYAPILLGPEVKYGNPRLGLAFGIVQSSFDKPGLDLVARVSATLNTGPMGTWLTPLTIGVTIVDRFGGVLRIDTGVFLNASLAGKSKEPSSAGLEIPFGMAFQVTPAIAIVPNTGLRIDDLEKASDTLAIPVGLSALTFVRLSEEYHGFVLGPFFAWPSFATPTQGQKIHTDVFVTGLTVAALIPL